MGMYVSMHACVKALNTTPFKYLSKVLQIDFNWTFI